MNQHTKQFECKTSLECVFDGRKRGPPSSHMPYAVIVKADNNSTPKYYNYWSQYIDVLTCSP